MPSYTNKDDLAKVPRPARRVPWWEDTSTTAQALRGHLRGRRLREREGLDSRDASICRMAANGIASREIADRFNLSRRRINQIRKAGSQPVHSRASPESPVGKVGPSLPAFPSDSLGYRRRLSSALSLATVRLAKCRGLKRQSSRPPLRPTHTTHTEPTTAAICKPPAEGLADLKALEARRPIVGAECDECGLPYVLHGRCYSCGLGVPTAGGHRLDRGDLATLADTWPVYTLGAPIPAMPSGEITAINRHKPRRKSACQAE